MKYIKLNKAEIKNDTLNSDTHIEVNENSEFIIKQDGKEELAKCDNILSVLFSLIEPMLQSMLLEISLGQELYDSEAEAIVLESTEPVEKKQSAVRTVKY